MTTIGSLVMGEKWKHTYSSTERNIFFRILYSYQEKEMEIYLPRGETSSKIQC